MIEFDKNGKEKLRRLLSLTRKAVQDYDLIKDGDKVCVGISGGKDSLALLATLANLRRFYPKKFELQAVTVSLGFKEMDFSPVKEFCEALEMYRSQDINNSITSCNPLVRMFAILDRRIGKRTLNKLKNEISKQPFWLQQFYELRISAEL